MAMDLTGITNVNEYYTNHYLSSIFEENVAETLTAWRSAARDAKNSVSDRGAEEARTLRTPWSLLRDCARRYYAVHERFDRSRFSIQTMADIKSMADRYLEALGYSKAAPARAAVGENLEVPVYLEAKGKNGRPLVWILLAASEDKDEGILDKKAFLADDLEESGRLCSDSLTQMSNEELVTKVFFSEEQPPRFIVLIGMNQIALLDRNKWNEKRYLLFELNEIFSRRMDTTLQAMAVLLHHDSLCPSEGQCLLDSLDESSYKHSVGVSQDLKYALRESIELLGNEVLYDMVHNKGINLDADPVDAGELTLQCLRYMYRMLFMLFIEARPELGYAPVKAQPYLTGYSLESLRDIADSVRDAIEEVGEGDYLHQSLKKLYTLIYEGYPSEEDKLKKFTNSETLHDTFVIQPLKAHLFDPEFVKMIDGARLRNSVMLRIIELMSLTRAGDKKNSRRGRISYANLGINQLGAVYEALLSYRGFIAEQDLYEVKRAGDKFNELDVGYFVPESELDQYNEDERVRYESGPNKGKLRMYPKGTFIYRLAGREREKSASYYTPESLTKCLVKYALEELLKGKTADEILNLTVCEPAMGSAAFLNEVINQLAEAYLTRKQKELNKLIPAEERTQELQKVKMYIADRNVYGIDLNPTAVELAEVSLWLNTIYKNGLVPWFGTQLVCGNSLIGARHQVYSTDKLETKTKGLCWYDNAPESLPLRKKRKADQVYHFLLGDPGMSAYNDKVIKKLAPENIDKIKKWNKEFLKPYDKDELLTLKRLSKTIDLLWEEQVELRKNVEKTTLDGLSVFGREGKLLPFHTSIREKDRILSKLYRSEHQRNAGPYARLKFAMDYWCSLWFWPIDKAEELPHRSEFLNELSLILEGTLNVSESMEVGSQLSLFHNEQEQRLLADIEARYSKKTGVNLDELCSMFPRLALVKEIANKNKFMHWELEFADLFDDHGGFDLIIGNPPWIKLRWNEKAVMSENNPRFAVKKLSAVQTASLRSRALEASGMVVQYFHEYESITGQMDFLNAKQNYPDLKGVQTNSYKCFLPQAWGFMNVNGVSAFVHPEGVYNDTKGGNLREKIYPRLRKHFMFENERKLFAEVDGHTRFSLNVYGVPRTISFDSISNLYDVLSISECYNKDNILLSIPEIKDEEGDWNVRGHPDRIIRVTSRELELFAKLFDGNSEWKKSKLPVIYINQFLSVLKLFAKHKITLESKKNSLSSSLMWDETNSQEDGTIARNIHFPNNDYEMIYSGPHIQVANPFFKSSRRKCSVNSDFDCIDLSILPKNYRQRCNYIPHVSLEEYNKRSQTTQWGQRYNESYRILARQMLNQTGERTLTCSIMPKKSAHINTIFSFTLKDVLGMMTFAGCESSLLYDFFVKCTGRSHLFLSTILPLPYFEPSENLSITIRALLLNCLTESYEELWEQCWNSEYVHEMWSKNDPRLLSDKFLALHKEWDWSTPLRTDYERRQALVELDVLVAMAIGITLEQLKMVYRFQFPLLRNYESDTWYDAKGRIVFTNNNGLTGVGFSRSEWKNIKDAPAGTKFYRAITDDTMPGGPIERTIEYVAPFDRCDRERDYETAWEFFEKKYRNKKRRNKRT